MKEFSSFRDPSGYVFEENGILMRKIASSYLPEYRRLIESGLYRELVAGKLLVPHKELTKPDEVHGLVIQPLRIPMISYPYEWSFSMIQDAALLTLEIQKRALNHKMILKDASAYNVQFVSGRPVFIDTLSFEEYREGEPWGAYGQFCRHFLAPLLLMAHTDLRLNRLAELFLDGIPLDLASRLLRGKGGLFALIHIHLHARSISRHNQDNRMMVGRRAFHLSRRSFYSLLESLQQKIESLRLRKICTEWGEYYSETNYSDAASQSKESAVRELLAETVVTGWIVLEGLPDDVRGSVLAKASQEDRLTGWDMLSFDEMNDMCAGCPLSWDKGRGCIGAFGPDNSLLPEIAGRHGCPIVASVPEAVREGRRFTSDDAKELLREVEVLKEALPAEGKMMVRRYSGPVDRMEAVARISVSEGCGFFFF